MPNWCNNELTIRHPDPAMLEKALAAWNKGQFLQTLIPCPRPLRETQSIGYAKTNNPETLVMIERQEALEAINMKHYGFKDWYDWCIKNWGTKWDIGYRDDHGEKAEIEDGAIQVVFDSAWSPPVDAYNKLVKMGFEIEAYYYEPGFGFCGEYRDGSDQTYKTSDPPEHLDRIFGISENNEMWRAA